MRLTDLPAGNASPTEEKILRYVRKYPRSAVRFIVSGTNLTHCTVQRIVKDLTDRGWLAREKVGRTYVYWETD